MANSDLFRIFKESLGHIVEYIFNKVNGNNVRCHNGYSPDTGINTLVSTDRNIKFIIERILINQFGGMLIVNFQQVNLVRSGQFNNGSSRGAGHTEKRIDLIVFERSCTVSETEVIDGNIVKCQSICLQDLAGIKLHTRTDITNRNPLTPEVIN